MIRAVSDMAVNEKTITSAACEEVSGIAREEPRGRLSFGTYSYC